MKKIWNWIDYNPGFACLIYWSVVLIFLVIASKCDSKKEPVTPIQTDLDSINIINTNLNEEINKLDSIKQVYQNNAESLTDSDAIRLFWELLHS